MYIYIFMFFFEMASEDFEIGKVKAKHMPSGFFFLVSTPIKKMAILVVALARVAVLMASPSTRHSI